MPGAAHVITEYKDLLARTETLIREFQPSLSAGTVITTVPAGSSRSTVCSSSRAEDAGGPAVRTMNDGTTCGK